eukprot:scpid93729/ scgid27968/ 
MIYTRARKCTAAEILHLYWDRTPLPCRSLRWHRPLKPEEETSYLPGSLCLCELAEKQKANNSIFICSECGGDPLVTVLPIQARKRRVSLVQCRCRTRSLVRDQ